MFKLTKFLMLMLFLGSFINVFDASAEIIIADSCSQSDVQAAINSAINGDIVKVPAGNCTWDSQINMNKQIVLIGAGIGNTNITNNDNGILVTTGTHNWRISGFTFNTSNNNLWAIKVNLYKSHENLNFRISHNKFDGYRYGVYIFGMAIGVIDHNQFLQGGLHYDGDDDDAWKRDSNFGSSDFVFVEDNTFDNGSATNVLHAFTANRGAMVVFRYNTITETPPKGIPDPFDAHGY